MYQRPAKAVRGLDPYGENQPVWSKAPRPVSWRVQVAMLVLFWSCVAALLAGRAMYLEPGAVAMSGQSQASVSSQDFRQASSHGSRDTIYR